MYSKMLITFQLYEPSVIGTNAAPWPRCPLHNLDALLFIILLLLKKINCPYIHYNLIFLQLQAFVYFSLCKKKSVIYS